MHGLIFCTVQSFVQDTYGPEAWADIADATDPDRPIFETMFHYDAAELDQLLRHASEYLGKPRDAFLEDLGIYLVSHPKREGLRRLLRFSGEDFLDFMHSLEDLPGRARLAVFDLNLPELEVVDVTPHRMKLSISNGLPGFGRVLQGVLQAMADDYGALVVMEYDGNHAGPNKGEQIELMVVEPDFASGRAFSLSAAKGETRQ